MGPADAAVSAENRTQTAVQSEDRGPVGADPDPTQSWGRLAKEARLAPVRAELAVMRAFRREQVAALSGPPQQPDRGDTGRRGARLLRAALRASLDEIESALSRAERGDYGACVQCGEQVAHERLRAVPETPWCARCEPGPRSRHR